MRAVTLLVAAVAAMGIGVGVAGAADGSADVIAKRAALKADYRRPAEIPYPADNPYSAEKARLGEMLFFDPRVSGAKNASCATCHNPALGWGDGLPKGIGAGSGVLGRRTPTILNLAGAKLLMWDGRKKGLEDQAFGPIETPAEMNQNGDELVAKLAQIQGYLPLFANAFPTQGLNKDSVAKAIATYERGVVSGQAPFDRWVEGNEDAISASAKRGFDLFNGKGHCASCHSGWSFTNHGFADIGVPDADIGRGAFLKLESMQHAFKTPTLRDITLRGPYMHNGSMATLAEVVRHYDTGFVQRPSLSGDIKRLNLTAQDVDDLVSFMATLTSDAQPVPVPVLPPSRW
jgi:cytochrome c peroxidase